MNEQLQAILAEIDQLEIAARIEEADDKPNAATLLAIKTRVRELDHAAARHMAGVSA